MVRLDLVHGAAAAEPLVRAGAELAAGRMVVLRDDRERGGEGDLLLGAEFADAAAINFMVTEARGVVCLALSAARCERLGLEQIGPRGNATSLGDSSMVSIEAREGVSTGISAADRARTIAAAAAPDASAADLVQPGHVFPLRARRGGVLERAGRIEAAVEAARLAGLGDAAVLCQVLRDDGAVARDGDLDAFAARHGLATFTVSDVACHRRAAEPEAAAEAAETGRLMRDVMGHFATGVSIVTSRDAAGTAVGTTANAVSSVSLDPPLLLACLARSSETLAAIRDGRRFAVNVLADDQRHHSDRFAAKGDAARSHEVGFVDHEIGVPVLPGALATIACEVEAMHPAGDHEIVVGAARDLTHSDGRGQPLLFYRGTYSRLTIEEDELAA